MTWMTVSRYRNSPADPVEAPVEAVEMKAGEGAEGEVTQNAEVISNEAAL